MTIPSERTRALIWASGFLQELSLKADTPDSIRAKAIDVLRHFPNANEIGTEAEYQLNRQQEVLKQAWLLPVDYYKRTHTQSYPTDDGPLTEKQVDALRQDTAKDLPKVKTISILDLADAAKSAAERGSAAIDDSLNFIDKSNLRIEAMENAGRKSKRPKNTG